MIGAAIFAAAANVLSLLQALFLDSFYGFGFLIGSALFCLFAWLRLCKYLKKLKYNVLSKQPMFVSLKKGFFTQLADRMEARAQRVEKHRYAYAHKYDDKDERTEP